MIRAPAIGQEVPGLGLRRRACTGTACRLCLRTLTSGLTAGILLGSLVATAINNFYSATGCGTTPGGYPSSRRVFGLFSVYLRRWLHETPVFAELQQRKALLRKAVESCGPRSSWRRPGVDAADLGAVGPIVVVIL